MQGAGETPLQLPVSPACRSAEESHRTASPCPADGVGQRGEAGAAPGSGCGTRGEGCSHGGNLKAMLRDLKATLNARESAPGPALKHTPACSRCGQKAPKGKRGTKFVFACGRKVAMCKLCSQQFTDLLCQKIALGDAQAASKNAKSTAAAHTIFDTISSPVASPLGSQSPSTRASDSPGAYDGASFGKHGGSVEGAGLPERQADSQRVFNQRQSSSSCARTSWQSKARLFAQISAQNSAGIRHSFLEWKGRGVTDDDVDGDQESALVSKGARGVCESKNLGVVEGPAKLDAFYVARRDLVDLRQDIFPRLEPPVRQQPGQGHCGVAASESDFLEKDPLLLPPHDLEGYMDGEVDRVHLAPQTTDTGARPGDVGDVEVVGHVPWIAMQQPLSGGDRLQASLSEMQRDLEANTPYDLTPIRKTGHPSIRFSSGSGRAGEHGMLRDTKDRIKQQKGLFGTATPPTAAKKNGRMRSKSNLELLRYDEAIFMRKSEALPTRSPSSSFRRKPEALPARPPSPRNVSPAPCRRDEGRQTQYTKFFDPLPVSDLPPAGRSPKSHGMQGQICAGRMGDLAPGRTSSPTWRASNPSIPPPVPDDSSCYSCTPSRTLWLPAHRKAAPRGGRVIGLGTADIVAPPLAQAQAPAQAERRRPSPTEVQQRPLMQNQQAQRGMQVDRGHPRGGISASYPSLAVVAHESSEVIGNFAGSSSPGVHHSFARGKKLTRHVPVEQTRFGGIAYQEKSSAKW